MGEVLFYEPALAFPKEDAENTLADLTQHIRTSWRALRFGRDGFKGYLGITSDIDSEFVETTCTNETDSVTCYSLNDAMDELLMNGEKAVREQVDMTTMQRFSAVSRSYQLSQFIQAKLSNVTVHYTEHASSSCGFGFSGLYFYIPLFCIMLLLSVLLFNYLDTFININHQIRNMFLLIPSDAAGMKLVYSNNFKQSWFRRLENTLIH